MARSYDEKSVVSSLKRVGIRTNVVNNLNGSIKQVLVPVNTTVGIHQWGKIDYLINYCNYVLIRSGNKDDVKSSAYSRKTKKQFNNKKERDSYKACGMSRKAKVMAALAYAEMLDI